MPSIPGMIRSRTTTDGASRRKSSSPLRVTGRDRPTARILWWSTAVFFAAELVCGGQIYLAQGKSGGLDPRRLKRAHLIAHQRDQRRDDDAQALAMQSGQLIAKRFAAAGRHQHECIAPAQHLVDDGLLAGPERAQAEHLLERVFD